MALIKCPECGQEVSSTVHQCVHCGFSFTVCPDCGEVFESSATVCPNCGCVLKIVADAQPAQQSATQNGELNGSVVNTTALSEWDNRFAEQKRKEKNVKLVNKALDIVGTAFIVIAFIVLFVWTKKESVERFESFKSVLRTVMLLTVFGGILWTVSTTVGLVDDVFLPYFCRKKMLNEKWDVKGFLKEHANDYTTEETAKTYGACVTAAYWQDEPKACAREFIKLASALLNVVSAICILIFLLRVEDRFIMLWRIDQKFNWDNFSYGVLIAAGVMTAVELIIYVTLGVIGETGKEKWLEKLLSRGEPKE